MPTSLLIDRRLASRLLEDINVYKAIIVQASLPPIRKNLAGVIIRFIHSFETHESFEYPTLISTLVGT
jgi:hypothetical protein